MEKSLFEKRESPVWSGTMKLLVEIRTILFFWLFYCFHNRNTRHEELFGHIYLTVRKELRHWCGCNHKLTDGFLLQVTFYRSQPRSFVFVLFKYPRKIPLLLGFLFLRKSLL